MLHKEEIKIVELFRLRPFAEITLQEIMQKLGKKSYNWTYLAVQKLAKKGILHTRKIGKTIVCKFNFDSYEAVTYLIHSERLAVRKTPEIINSIKKITPFFVLIAQKDKYSVIVENEEIKKKLNFNVFTKDEFKSLLIAPEENTAKKLARDHTIPYGAEIYYSILTEAHLHGFRG